MWENFLQEVSCHVWGRLAAKDHVAASRGDKVWCAPIRGQITGTDMLPVSVEEEDEEGFRELWEEGWAKSQTSKGRQASPDHQPLDTSHKRKLRHNYSTWSTTTPRTWPVLWGHGVACWPASTITTTGWFWGVRLSQVKLSQTKNSEYPFISSGSTSLEPVCDSRPAENAAPCAPCLYSVQSKGAPSCGVCESCFVWPRPCDQFTLPAPQTAQSHRDSCPPPQR